MWIIVIRFMASIHIRLLTKIDAPFCVAYMCSRSSVRVGYLIVSPGNMLEALGLISLLLGSARESNVHVYVRMKFFLLEC